ncbi:nucleotide binding protein [Apiospora kogelbergensis]|uniref:nucleotide binding protein n=1 Tax=Apiospora kogelbergensis TaxID=1337665 RepID=UPI003131CC57
MELEEDLDQTNLFEEPADFAPPKPPTKQVFKLASGKEITIHLVGYNLYEGHYLWNGSRFVSQWIETHVSEIQAKTVLEIGAGGGLPSLVAAHLGARKTVVTDYPDQDLIVNINKNIDEAAAQGLLPAPTRDHIVADGYKWADDPAPLLAHINAAGTEGGAKMTMSRRRESRAWVFFTSYRPWLKEKDLGFFDLAREQGFKVEKVFETRMDKPMFENDPGDLEVQKTCTGWEIRWPEDQCVA